MRYFSNPLVWLFVLFLSAPCAAQSVDQLKTQARGLMKAGKYAEAVAVYQQALPIAERTNGPSAFATVVVMNELANAYEAISEFHKAAELYQRCVTAIEKQKGPNDSELGTLLNNLGVIHQNLADFTKAEECFKRALSISRLRNGPNSVENATETNNLANVYKEMGDYIKAEPLYVEAIRLYESSRNDKLPTGLTNLAGLYREMGQYDKAQALYERALKIREAKLGPAHPDVGSSLNSLGQLYRAKGDLETAKSFLQKSLKVREASLGPEHTLVASTLNNLGSIHERQGDFEEAESMYRRCLNIREKTLGPDHPDLALVLNNLAGLLNEQQKKEAAEATYEKAIALLERQPKVNPASIALIVGNLASQQAGQKHWDAASDAYDKTRRLSRSYLSDLLPGLPEREQLAFLRVKDTNGFHAALSFGYLRRDDPQVAARSAEWLINGKAVTFEALAHKGLKQQTTPKTADRWVTLEAVRAAIPDNTSLIDIAAFPIRNFDVVGHDNRWLPSRYVAWIIPPAGKGDVRILDLGPAQDIDAMVSAARTTITESAQSIANDGEEEAERLALAALKPLSERLLAPLLQNTQPNQRLIISPDAALWILPWSALPIDATNYAVEKYEMTFVVSSRSMITTKGETPTGQPIIFADPSYDLSPSQVQAFFAAVMRGVVPALLQFAPSIKLPPVARLEGTATEAAAISEKIKEFLGQEPIIYQEGYAQENIVKVCRQPKLMVIATHGFFLEQQTALEDDPGAGVKNLKAADGKPLENPLLRCGLLMAGCNQGTPGSDGILTGLEIASTDLKGTQLVVLSACETGLGRIQNGEGVAGLRQSFHLAGAEAVLASLWPVEDRSTARLMTGFFSHLSAGQSRSSALKQSQMELIEWRRERYGSAHPFFWSAFNLTDSGDDSP